MWRSRLGWSGLASLLLHVMLLALLWRDEPPAPRPAPEPERPAPLWVEIRSSPPEPAPAPPAPTPPPRPEPRKPRPAEPPPPEKEEKPPVPEPAREPEPAPEPTQPEPAREPGPASEPAQEETPAPASGPSEQPGDAPLSPADRPSLLPSTPGEGWGLPVEPEKPRGRTLRPGDPSLSPEVLAAEERARVGGRVQGFMNEQLSRQRVENGLIHPYFGQVRAALEKQFEGAPLFEGEGLKGNLQHLARTYQNDAARFGATGNPGGQVPPVPTPTEILRQKVGEEPAYEGLRARLQAGDELRVLGDGGRGTGLLVVVELEQGPEGALRSARVVKQSGNAAYDAYVLEKLPAALATLAPPPPKAAGVRPEGIHTVWAVEGRVMYRRKLSEMKGEDAWYLAAMSAAGVLTGSFEETTGDVYVVDLRNPWFSIKPRLLQVY